jgi:FAD/FMN-containing dehydrogenase
LREHLDNRMLEPPSSFRGIFRHDRAALAVYSEGAGIARVIPRAVAVPADIADVQTLVRWAAATRSVLIPRGSGSGMAGGAVGDGVIVDLSRFREITPVDVASRSITVGVGVIRQEIEDAAHAVGLHFPPDPSSGAFCTIGGMVSTNASGAHSLKYGPTRPWVTALDCVFDDGSRATVRRGIASPIGVAALQRASAIAGDLRAAEKTASSIHAGVRKDSSGYGIHAFVESGDLIDLLIGSEGTLAIVVGVELALTDAPVATSSLLGVFPTLESAVTAAVAAREAGAAACELLDRTFLDVAASEAPLPQIPAGSEAVLLAEVEGDSKEDAHQRAETLAAAFRAANATTVELALTSHEEEEMWELRHAASPILARLGSSLTSMQFVEDSAVPPERLPEYVRGVREILEAHDVKGVIFGHAGDSHIHVNPLIDVNHAGWHEVVASMLADVVTLTASLGGTLDGEHGDGRLRTPLLRRVWPETVIERFRSVKQAFDPEGIFNPGVKVALPGERAIADIKYDPTLAAHPANAVAALARVSDERIYSTFRLDLLGPSA